MKTSKNPKIIFFGTPTPAANLLEGLILKGYKPDLVITQKDKPVGRRQILTPPPVKKIAEKYKINVFQPESIKSDTAIKKIKSASPDLIVVLAYGQIIPKEILNIPKYGAINIHGSLLPKYRGASPVQTAILNGDKYSGITLMLMDEKLDHGPTIAKKRVKISKKETSESLLDKLTKEAERLLVKTIPLLIQKKLRPKPQNHKKASYTKLIKKDDGKINPKKETAIQIERKFRAFYPWPGIFLELKTKEKNKLRLKIISLKIEKCQKQKKFLELKNKKLILKTKRGCLWLKEVQPESKQKMPGEAFFFGYKEKLNLKDIL